MVEIPFVDLRWQHSQIRAEVEPLLYAAMDAGRFILGPVVRDFEVAFAGYWGFRDAIGVGNGTDALELGLRALDVGPGDEVIIPTNSFIASAAAVVQVGAVPVLVDVNDMDLLIDVEAIRAAITPRTRVIMPVHLFGQLANVPAISQLATEQGLFIIEDASQCHGARGRNYNFGAHSHLITTSFYPGKNLGAYGDGGAVLTNDPAIADRIRLLRDHGSSQKYVHKLWGRNSRLDALQATVLHVKLRYLDEWNTLRREAALRYESFFSGSSIVRRPPVTTDLENAWHIYAIRISKRDQVFRHLANNGIAAGIHYPVPIHEQPPMRVLGGDSLVLPVAERAAMELLSLPLFPGITDSQQHRVVDVVLDAIQ